MIYLLLHYGFSQPYTTLHDIHTHTHTHTKITIATAKLSPTTSTRIYTTVSFEITLTTKFSIINSSLLKKNVTFYV